MKNRNYILITIVSLVLLAWGSLAISAQTNEFNYQGRLTDNGTAPTGSYDLQFDLFDAASGGTQKGSTVTLTNVLVSGGVFTVKLDFGDQFDGNTRFLQMAVKAGGSTVPYIALNPRQAISSTPYAVRSKNAAIANDSTQLGGIDANQYVLTNDPRLNGTPGNYVQNTMTEQADSNFNVSGRGVVGGTLTADRVGIGTVLPLAKFSIAVNGGQMLAGDAGCGPGYTGIGFGFVLSNCENYSLLGNGTDTFINSPPNGSILFRQGNSRRVEIKSDGTFYTHANVVLGDEGNLLVTGDSHTYGKLSNGGRLQIGYIPPDGFSFQQLCAGLSGVVSLCPDQIAAKNAAVAQQAEIERLRKDVDRLKALIQIRDQNIETRPAPTQPPR